MERTNSIRNTIESWRGGGVRRLIGDLGQRLVGGSAEQPTARDTHYGEPFWQQPARASAVPRKRRELWREQGELWQEADTHAEHVTSAQVFEERPLREPVAASRRADGFGLVAEPVPNSGLSSIVPRPRVVGQRLDIVAKFLQVNDAVHGMRGGSGLALPRGQFSARCSLWRGARVGTPFLMGC